MLEVDYVSAFKTLPFSTLRDSKMQSTSLNTFMWARCGSDLAQASLSILYKFIEERSPERIALRP